MTIGRIVLQMIRLGYVAFSCWLVVEIVLEIAA